VICRCESEDPCTYHGEVVSLQPEIAVGPLGFNIYLKTKSGYLLALP